jgi:hypothetical protein
MVSLVDIAQLHQPGLDLSSYPVSDDETVFVGGYHEFGKEKRRDIYTLRRGGGEKIWG